VTRVVRAAGALLAVGGLLAGCGLTSGSPRVDAVQPVKVGHGKPRDGATLTVTSKQFSEQLVLGLIAGLALKAAGAQVVDRTGIQGSIGAREAVKSGEASLMYEYTGTGWITYLGHTKPIPDPHKQWVAVRDGDRKNGITWLPPSTLNNTYSLGVNQATYRKYHVDTLSQMAKVVKRDPAAGTFCVGAEFAARNDGFPGMTAAYGLQVPASRIKKMDDGIIYTQVAKGRSCTFGQVYTTDGRIRALKLHVLKDDRHFFPVYNAAPVVNSKVLKEHPQIAQVLAPITKKLDTATARRLNGQVDVQGRPPRDVARDWLVKEGFIKAG
jgi:osmoprotectant transport system substrate-binding protein